jgi:hypothetical protein
MQEDVELNVVVPTSAPAPYKGDEPRVEQPSAGAAGEGKSLLVKVRACASIGRLLYLTFQLASEE